MLKDGVARDIGGHLFILVGYENLPDHTRWYRFKNSGGVHTALIELVPGARFPTRLVNGYIYLEREVLERILMGALVPAAFTPAIENSAS